MLSAAVREGVLDTDYSDNLRGGRLYKKGESCWLVTGQVQSELEENKYMTMIARGYDANGQEVIHTLDHGPIMGVISIYLPAKGFGGFIIHLNPASQVSKIVLSPSTELYDIAPP